MGDVLERRRARGRSMGTYRGLASLGFGLMAFISGAIADRTSLRVPYMLGSGLAAAAFFLSFVINEKEIRAPARADDLEVSDVDGRVIPPEGASERAERRLPIAPLLVSAFLWSLIFGAVYSVWANYMVDELNYSQTMTTRLWSIASSSEFPFMILAGWLSDRVGRLPMLSLGFLGWALVFLGYIVMPVMPWIVLIQLTRGFAYSAYTATAMTYATEVRSREKRGRASGLYSSSGGLGSILGSVMGGTLTQMLGFVPMIGICAALMVGAALYLGVCALRWQARSGEVAEVAPG
jgi:MFS family permease